MEEEKTTRPWHSLSNFEIAFAEGDFKERSKLHHVSMYLKALINLSLPLSKSSLAACLLVAENAAAAPTAAVAATAHAGRGCSMILLLTSHVGLPTPAQAHANRRAPIPASVAPTALATLALVEATSHVTYSSKALSIEPTPTEKSQRSLQINEDP
ncbi:hypothetical protein L7F22_029003 [Adiantum nelumboides]|nr:hypothetical protein [Adiantum nelumboides]